MRTWAYVIAGSLAMLPIAACSTAPKTESQRDTLQNDAKEALARFKEKDASLNNVLSKSAGYAVLPEVGKGGLGIGGSYGRGVVYENGRFAGYCDLTQGTIGLQAGGQSFSELIVFLKQSELDKFKDNTFQFAANASAVAITSGAAGSADYSKGVLVFTLPRGGLMAEASVGGQRFSFVPE